MVVDSLTQLKYSYNKNAAFVWKFTTYFNKQLLFINMIKKANINFIATDKHTILKFIIV